ncbi:MAG: GTPase HflX [Bacillota bacterium]
MIGKNNEFYQIEKQKEKAILIGKVKSSVEELEKLAKTAKIKVLGKLLHSRKNIDAAYYIGSGKLEELKNSVKHSSANLIIFDHELTPAQHRNLEEDLDTNVMDRTQLILNIFSQHAHTKESKLQVEKAQLEYLLPRLTGKGEELSRLAGGIGTRGPGESKLETDRRRISKRIHNLEEKLEKVKKNREVQRKERNDPLVALVGYTNAGKSTIMNLLTGANNEVANKLFATLDSTLRNMQLPNGREIILTDTVGFIDNLPHQLVASFRATLEEIKKADLILHIVDSSNPQAEKHIEVTNEVLKDMNVNDIEKLLVFNKIDKCQEINLKSLELQYPAHLSMSALTGKGKDKLLEKIKSILEKNLVKVSLKLPYDKGNWIEKIHNKGRVIEEKYSKNDIFIKAKIPKKFEQILSDYKI